MNPKRSKIESALQSSLFELESPPELTSTSEADRPFSLPDIFLGTSSFTASGWEGSFYPMGMRSKHFLRHYASQFQTVEIDSTFYGTPSPSTVTSWNEKTPRDFIFSDFVYVRWLGNRKSIEEQTTTWDKAVIDRQNDLRSWVVVLRRLVEDKRIRKIFAFANNHYAGHAPATVKQFMDLWDKY